MALDRSGFEAFPKFEDTCGAASKKTDQLGRASGYAADNLIGSTSVVIMAKVRTHLPHRVFPVFLQPAKANGLPSFIAIA